jgi:phosphatidylglycerol---prolipoprotein diacylglyceryl transferase
MNSEMIGIPAGVPRAFIFQRIDTVPRHNAQLYETIYCILSFAILSWMWIKKRATRANGLMSGTFSALLSTGRFVDEFFKINQEDFENQLPIDMRQMPSIPFILAGIHIVELAISGKTGHGFSTTNAFEHNFQCSK